MGDLMSRGVTKFQFKFDNVRTLNVFNRFEIRQMSPALCYWIRIRGKSLFYDWYQCTESQRAQTNQFFSAIQPTTQTTVMCNI